MQISLLTSVEEARAVYGEVAALFQRCFQRELDRERWAQYYFHNPYGAPLVTLARNQAGELIGHSGMIAQQLVDRHGKIYPYCLSISLMIDPQHREGFTTFYTLFGAATRAAQEREVPFLLAFPNANSFLLLRHGFGWRELFESGLFNWQPASVSPPETLRPLACFGLGDEVSHPCDDTYRQWRSRACTYHSELVNERTAVIYKLLEDGVLNILDVQAEQPAEGAHDLAALASHTGALMIRLSGIHARAAGLPEHALRQHSDYRLRLCYVPLMRHSPRPRFSLLLSDVF
jgi:hypothetical protein